VVFVLAAVVLAVLFVQLVDVEGDAPSHAAANSRAQLVVSPPMPTTELGATCGTKMVLRLQSAATECEALNCGRVSISTLVPSITPSTAPPIAALEPVYSAYRPC